MEELNIKCNNRKEAEFIEKYFSDKGYNWTYKNSLSFKNKEYLKKNLKPLPLSSIF